MLTFSVCKLIHFSYIRGNILSLRKIKAVSHKARILFPIFIIVLIACGCNRYPVNPNTPNADISLTIYPNSHDYYNLNTVSGWMYITTEAPSRGVIVYRQTWDTFLAYDRIPPNFPDNCCDNEGNCSRLVVDFPFVWDSCNMIQYNIIYGGIITDETNEAVYPLIQYKCLYDGYVLRITNF